MKVDEKKVTSILFITLSNLGDIILTTPVLEKLHNEFPAAEIDVITGVAGKEIFAQHPAIRDIAIHKRRKSVFSRIPDVVELYRKKYSLVVDLKNSLIPYIVGATYHSHLCVPSIGKILKPKRQQKILHKVQEHLSRLVCFGIDILSDIRFFVPASSEDIKKANDVVSAAGGAQIVIVNPGAKSHLKRWPVEKYVQLIEEITAKLNCKIYIVGNEDDSETVDQIVAHLKIPIVNLCCKTSIGTLVELMRRASLVITNDSAPLHLASAAGAPTVAIFGPTDDRKYGPLSKKRSVLKPDLECRPCEKAQCELGLKDGCISQVKVEDVFLTAKEILSDPRRQTSDIRPEISAEDNSSLKSDV